MNQIRNNYSNKVFSFFTLLSSFLFVVFNSPITASAEEVPTDIQEVETYDVEVIEETVKEIVDEEDLDEPIEDIEKENDSGIALPEIQIRHETIRQGF